MPTTNKRSSFADRIRKAFADAGEELAQTLPEAAESGPEDTHIHVHMNGSGEAPAAGQSASAAPTKDDPIEQRFASLEKGHAELNEKLDKLLAAINPTADGDVDTDGQDMDGPADANALGGANKDKVSDSEGMPDEVQAANSSKTNDSVALETSFKAVLADAEILVPGYRGATFDAKARRRATMDSMCKMRRGVLGQLASTEEGAKLLSAVANDQAKTIDSMSCVGVASIFRAAAAAKRVINNGESTRDAQRAAMVNGGAKPKLTPAELNKLNRKHYAS